MASYYVVMVPAEGAVTQAPADTLDAAVKAAREAVAAHGGTAAIEDAAHVVIRRYGVTADGVPVRLAL